MMRGSQVCGGGAQRRQQQRQKPRVGNELGVFKDQGHCAQDLVGEAKWGRLKSEI